MFQIAWNCFGAGKQKVLLWIIKHAWKFEPVPFAKNLQWGIHVILQYTYDWLKISTFKYWEQYDLRICLFQPFSVVRFQTLQLQKTMKRIYWMTQEFQVLEFVAGHGAVVQSDSINIVFEYKQVQQ